MINIKGINLRKTIYFLPVIIPIIIFFIFNTLTPFWFDDFNMACLITEWHSPEKELLTSFSDILISTQNMYFNWHGRIFTNFLNHLFMFFKDKNIFNICNTIVYSIFIFLVGFHITGSIKKVTPILFLFINILLWLELSAWGQNFLWLTGSFNYLWTTTFILIFLIPYRKKIDDISYEPYTITSILWFFIGILSGCSMENSAVGVFILLLSYFIFKIYKKEKLSLFEILGFIGFLIGFFVLINARFINHRQGITSSIIDLIRNTVNVGFYFISDNLLLLGIIILVGIELIKVKKYPLPRSTYGYFLAAIASVGAMILVGDYGGRSEFITKIFFIITLIILITQFKFFLNKYIVKAGCALLLITFSISFIYGTYSITRSYIFNEARERYIISEINKGNLNINVKSPIDIIGNHTAMYDSIDILSDPNSKQYGAHNSSRAAWYGIESINGIPLEDKTGIIQSFRIYLSRRKEDNLNLNDLFLIIYDNM